jgi:hypothetical protein
MTRVETIVRNLTEGSDLSAAAVLVAMDADRDFTPIAEGAEFVEQLEEIGCVQYGYVTPIGRDVAKELRRRGIVAVTKD